MPSALDFLTDPSNLDYSAPPPSWLSGASPMSNGADAAPSGQLPAAPMAAPAPAASALPPVQQPDMLPQQEAQPSFLSRLTATTPDGLTFQDRLMALGSILHGDGAGAQNYLQQQRTNATAQTKLAKADADRQKMAAAFKAAYAGGKFDPQVYANMAGSEFNPSDLEALAKAGGEQKFLTSRGSIFLGNATQGTMKPLYTAPNKLPFGWDVDDDTGEVSPTPGGPFDPKTIQANALTRRKVITGNPMPGKAGAAKKPKSYDAGQVNWGP